MRTVKQWAGLMVWAAAWAAGGCDSYQTEPSQSETSLGKTDFPMAWAASEKVMRNEFGQINSDQETRVIEAKPVYFENQAVSLSKQQLRRSCKAELVQHSGQWWASVVVNVERLDTRTYQQFEGQRSDRDYAAASPMESGESAPMSKKMVWVKLRRERGLERELLRRIREELGLYVRPTAGEPNAARP